ncbi:MAG: IS66 family transposase [Deltaproteobacteria bacterium]|jgi:transposase|nr:IS66 family transposase [Deltaproteobacteria bacterium]
MASSRSELPQDVEACHALIEQQQATIDRLSADMALLKRALFGSRRERFRGDDPKQQYLFDSKELQTETAEPEAKEDDQQPKPRRTSKGRGRRVFPELLPRKEVRHALKEDDIPEDLRDDPSAKRFFKKTSEELEYVPPSVYVMEHYQEVIVRDEATGETTIVTARKPPRLIDAYTGPGFWAYLTASRFADHLPYYRQEDILSRYGFRIGRSTQARWMAALARGVRPLVELMRSRALKSRVLGVDETPVKTLGVQVGTAAKAYLWGVVGDGAHPYDCFHFTTDRSRDGPEEFLSGYQGYLQSDAYVCYDSLSKSTPGIFQVGCWAHARRKFEEIHFVTPSLRTHTAMAYFQRLYDVEDRGHDLNEKQRHELRQDAARPIVAEFYHWLLEEYERELPKSKLRAAIGYMTNRWEVFERYLVCGAIPIDNNRTEAALKFAVLGRKAWLFFGNPQGGETAATLFTLTKSCNRHRVDPFAYLRDVYTRLPSLRESELECLLPDRWIAEHPEHLLEERVQEAQQRAQRTRARRVQRRRLARAKRRP